MYPFSPLFPTVCSIRVCTLSPTHSSTLIVEMAAAPLLACLLALCLVTLCDYLWKEALWTVSAEGQRWMQAAAPWAAGFFTVLATLSLVVTVVPQCVLFYFSGPYIGVQVAAINSLSSAWSGMLKLTYRDPRPFWVYPWVEGITCLKDWGTPSGHALYTSAVWGCLGVYLWRTTRRRSALCILAWLLLIGLDRLFVGAHFASQVVLGWAWGTVHPQARFPTDAGCVAWLQSVVHGAVVLPRTAGSAVEGRVVPATDRGRLLRRPAGAV